jgi:riboflavin kinase/FMN adenylyltransferase
VQLIRGLINVPDHLKKTVVTIGDFDGLHLGHQAIIHRLIDESKKHHLTSMVICFEPQPAEYRLCAVFSL